MTTILRDLPYQPESYWLDAPGRGTSRFEIRPNQIVCWASLTPENYSWGDSDRIPCFPILIDTGNGRNFTLQEKHLQDWAHVGALDAVRKKSQVKINNILVSLRAATLWLHRNVPGQARPDRSRIPLPIDFSPGIEVVPSEVNYPRLPLLGMRALFIARLELTVNGFDRKVNLRQLPKRS